MFGTINVKLIRQIHPLTSNLFLFHLPRIYITAKKNFCILKIIYTKCKTNFKYQ